MFPNIEFIDFRSFQINWNIFVFKLLQIHTGGNIFSIQSKLDAFCLSAKQNRTTVIATIGSIEFDNRTDRKVRVRLCLTTEPIEQQSNRLHSIDNAGYRTRATVSNWNSNVALFIVLKRRFGKNSRRYVEQNTAQSFRFVIYFKFKLFTRPFVTIKRWIFS